MVEKKRLDPPVDANYIQGEKVSDTIPADGEVLQYVAASKEYQPKPSGGGYILPDDIEDGGSAEMNVGGLSGELADPQRQKMDSFLHDNYAFTYNSAWTTIGWYLFRGTNVVGTPSKIVLLLFEGGVGMTAGLDVRIIDVDNLNTVICSQSSVAPATYPDCTTKDMGALSNIPTVQHRFAIQVQKVSGGANRYVGAFGGQIQW